MKLSVQEKIMHLRNLAFPGDLSEIEKMYSGKAFDTSNSEYRHLLKFSKQLCDKFSLLSALISVSKSQEEIEEYTREKSKILDVLFPGHVVSRSTLKNELVVH